MAKKLTHLSIKGLHGYLNFDVPIEDNRLIIVGENGSGKTSVLRILYQILSGALNGLLQYKFESVEIRAGTTRVKIDARLLRKSSPQMRPKYFERHFPSSMRRQIRALMNHIQEGTASPDEIEELCQRYGVPPHIFYDSVPSLFDDEDSPKPVRELVQAVEGLRGELGASVLYLPTYRRIEENLDRIFHGLDPEDVRHMRRRRMRVKESIELVEFGMGDVESSISKALEALKEFSRERLNTLTLGYLGAVVDEQYKSVDVKQIQEADEATIGAVLGRIQESILSSEQKKHLRETIDRVRAGAGSTSLKVHDQIICHYLIMLLSFQAELQKKEQRIKSFAEICTKYFSQSKECVYDSTSFQFFVRRLRAKKGADNLEIKHLSSGEKQIMSLFSHLYLSDHQTFFVLIDEPELSLSVPWQRQFLLDISQSDFCRGFVAVTHSPFMYDNELKPYAHGLGEFVV